MTKVVVLSIGQGLSKKYRHELETSLNNPWRDLQPLFLDDINFTDERALADMFKDATLFIALVGTEYGKPLPNDTRDKTEYQFDIVLEFCARIGNGGEKAFLILIPQKIEKDDSLNHFTERIIELSQIRYEEIDFDLYPFSDNQSFIANLHSGLRSWNVRQFHPGDQNATVYKHIDKLPLRPENLVVGQRILIESSLASLLERKENLLLWGIGGAGKSTLASAIAYEWKRWWLENAGRRNGNNVLWINVGNDDYNTVSTALSYPVDESKKPIWSKASTLSDLLTELQISLVVLDDCWNESTLREYLEDFGAIGIAVIATSRLKFELNGLHEIHVDRLDNDSAESLLINDVDECKPVLSDENRKLLTTICVQVENHPLHLMLLNRRLKADCKNNQQLELARISKMLREQYDIFYSKDSYLPKPHNSRHNFLLSMISTLPEKSHQEVFMACGAFFAPFLTVEMLLSYFDVPENRLTIDEITSALVTLDELGYLTLGERYVDHREEDRIITMHQLLFDCVYSQSDETRHQKAREVLDHLNDSHRQQPKSDELLMPYFANLLGMFACCLAHKPEYAGKNLRQYIPLTGDKSSQNSFMQKALDLLEIIAGFYGNNNEPKEQADLLQVIGNGYLEMHKEWRRKYEAKLRQIPPPPHMLDKALSVLVNARMVYEKQAEFERKSYVEVCMGIADCYNERNNPQEAVANYQAALPYADDPVQASSVAVDLAETFQKLDQDHDKEKIATLFSKALDATGQLTNSEFKVDQLTRIGKAFYKLELDNDSQKTLASAQFIAEDMGYYSGQGCRLCHLGKICAKNKELDEAEGYIDKAIKFTATTQNRQNSVCHRLRRIELHIAREEYLDAHLNIDKTWREIEDNPDNLHDYALELYNLWETVIDKLRESGQFVDNVTLLNEIQSLREKAQFNIPAIQWAQMSANIYLSQKNYVEAREEYKKALLLAQEHKHPFEEVVAYLQLGLLYQREENPDRHIEQSIQYITKAVAVAGRERIYDLQIFCYQILAHYYHDNGWIPQLETCLIDMFRLLQQTHSEDMDIYQSLFAMALEAGLYDHADEYHEVMTGRLPNEMEASAACLKLGLHYFELKAFKNAAIWMARALPFIREADSNLGYELSYMIASIYASLEFPDFRLAIEYFHRALENTNDEQRQMRCYIGLAQAYINTDESRTPEWLRRAEVIAFKRDAEEALETLIQCAAMYNHLEDGDSAIRCINAVLDAATQRGNTALLTECHLRLAKTYQAQQRYEEALNHFQIWSSFNLDTDIGCGLCHWAQICEATGQHETAVELLERAAISSRQYENHHNVLCNERRLGSILMNTEPPQKRRALLHFSRAIRAAYKSGEQDALVRLFEYCGDISFGLGKHEAAFLYLSHWQEMQAAYPDEVENAACMMCKLGQLHRMHGDYGTAKDLLQSAIETSDRTTEMNVNWGCHRAELASVYDRQGDEPANLKSLQIALDYLEQGRDIYVKVDALDRLEKIEQRIQNLKDRIDALKRSRHSKPSK